MDDHFVWVTMEFHVMADNPEDAAARVLDNLKRPEQSRDVYSHRVIVEVDPK